MGTLGAPPTPAPGTSRTGLALTKQLSMEQETRAVRLMVAGCLDQHTCPRSRCAARQPRAPAASRLRGPPDAAAARSERPGARTQALLPRASPLLSTMERARLRPPARAKKGGELRERPGRRRGGGGEGGGREAPGPRPPLSLLPQPGRRWRQPQPPPPPPSWEL